MTALWWIFIVISVIIVLYCYKDSVDSKKPHVYKTSLVVSRDFPRKLSVQETDPETIKSYCYEVLSGIEYPERSSKGSRYEINGKKYLFIGFKTTFFCEDGWPVDQDYPILIESPDVEITKASKV